MKITVIGGGSSAHVLIPLLSDTNMDVSLMTRKPARWSREPTVDYLKPDGQFIRTIQGKLSSISAEPADVIPEADIIILCLPVHVYRPVLHSIAPFINRNKRVYIGTVYGQGGFNWMVDEIKGSFGLSEARAFAFGLIPWICRTGEYGKKGIVYGAKPVNVAATRTQEDFEFLDDVLFDKVVKRWFGHGRFSRAANFLSLTMSLDNQIIHTSRMYGLYIEYGGSWEKKEQVPYFYRDFSKLSARILKGLDSDYSKIRKRLRKTFPEADFEYMLDYISLDNRTNLRTNKTYLDTFKNSSTLGAIRTPVVEMDGVWVIDTGHRFFKDDVLYGLCIAKSIASMFGMRTYHIDKTLSWAQKMMGERLINNNRLVIHDKIEDEPFKYGVPEVYGITAPGQLYG